jgi:dGTPase
VFVNHEGDHYRTRLTHTLEVSQIARTLSRCLLLNEDLTEALALAHDLGHPPFGHAGEEALSKMMIPYGGFDHNAQTFSIIARLEKCYPNFEGLNLSWETLEGIVKHNGPLLEGLSEKALPRDISDYNLKKDLELANFTSGEAQVAALADDIAYNNHDIDDGLRAGLFCMEDLFNIPLVGDVFKEVLHEFPKISQSRQHREAVRRLIGVMVDDCLTESKQRLKEAAIQTVDDLRGLEFSVITCSESMYEIDRSLKEFLFKNMYRHKRVTQMNIKAERIVRDLFNSLLAAPENLPDEWKKKVDLNSEIVTAQVVADYIAGMTDRFANDEHSKLFNLPIKTV